MEKFRTLIADDEPAAREGTRALLEQDAEIEVIAECDNGADAATVIIEQAPDIVVLDIAMPERDGFQCLELLDPAMLDDGSGHRVAKWRRITSWVRTRTPAFRSVMPGNGAVSPLTVR